MQHCEQEECTGHLGKFDSCRDEALYELSLSGYGESTGSTDWYGHFDLVVLDTPEEVGIYGPIVVTVPAGSYIVETSPSGLVNVQAFNDAASAQTQFDNIDTAYSAYLDQEEGADA